MPLLEFDKSITRIDLEKAGQGVFVYMWADKWEEGSAPSKSYYAEAKSIDRLLMEAEDAGFTCEMCDNSHGRALRGEIIRADILKIGEKWSYRTFPRGWTAKTRPLKDEEITEAKATEIINWCKEHKWKIREFPGGARAWKYEVMPVRDASTIMRLRRQIDAAFSRGEIDERRQFDLAFDC